MHAKRLALVLLNVLGGIAVLGSYVHGIVTHPDPGLVWGGVPEWLKPTYTTSMLTAAAGYFPFTWIYLRADPDRLRIGRAGYGLVLALYALVLVPSALWMPLTFRMLEHPSTGLWWLVRLVLALVGVGSVGLLVGLVRLQPRPATALLGVGIVGALAFCLQTAVLDALVWPAYWVR